MLSFVQIVATGVCHTDLYPLFEGMHKDGFPIVLGHEGAGIVESVGPGVTEFQPGKMTFVIAVFSVPVQYVIPFKKKLFVILFSTGDKVIPLSVSQCRKCRFCKSPKTNQCEKGW